MMNKNKKAIMKFKIHKITKKINKFYVKAKSFRIKNIFKKSHDYINEKGWLLKEREFWYLSAMFGLSLFSIPTVDHIIFTLIRLMFVLMLTVYMLYQIKLYANEGIKMDGFKPILDESWYWADRFWAFVFYLY